MCELLQNFGILWRPTCRDSDIFSECRVNKVRLETLDLLESQEQG